MNDGKLRKQISGKQAAYLAVILFLAGVLCIYVAAIFYINFSQRPSFYATDMYADVLVTVKMWEQKSFLPEGWVFSNQVYIMATPTLAALIYGITGDAFWSMAAASSVMTVLVLLSFDWMLKAAFPRPAERLFGVVMFLSLPVFFGDTIEMTNGWQLLFTMCSFYACYAINAFLAFGCYIRKDIRVPAAMIGLVCLLSFAMGVQSLRQTAVMTLPLLAMEFLQMICRLRQKKGVRCRSLSFVLAVSVCNFAGVVVNHFLDIPQVELFGSVGFANIRYLPQAIWSSIQNLCELFVQPEPNLLHQLALMVFVVLAVILYCRTRSQANAQTKALFALLLLSVLAIAGIDTVTTMEIRNIYYFMLYPLLAFLAVYVFANRHIAFKGLMLALLCAVFYFCCTIHVIPGCQWAHNSAYDVHYQISQDLLDRGYTTVYSAWNGCDKIAIASQGKIEAGFWRHNGEAYVAVQYLCDPTVLYEEPEHAAYVFYSESAVEPFAAQLREVGIELIPVLDYPEKDIYIYTAPVNLMQVLMEMESQS